MTKATRDALKAAAYTGLWTFLGMFALAVTGWLNDVQQWATSDNAATVFPDPAVLVKAAVAAVAAGAGFVVAAAVRLGQVAGIIPGAPPAYVERPKGDAGRGDPLYWALLVLVVVVIAIIVL